MSFKMYVATWWANLAKFVFSMICKFNTLCQFPYIKIYIMYQIDISLKIQSWPGLTTKWLYTF